MSQTSYSIGMTAGVPGLLADLRGNLVESYAAEGAVGFGAVLVKGTADNQVKVPTAGGAFRGIAVHTHATEPFPASSVQVGYPDKMPVNVLKRGSIWVTAAVAVADEDPAYYTATGALTNVAVGNTAIPSGKFRRTTSGAGLTLLEINLPA